MPVLLWFVAGEANAVLVKARAKAEAIQLLAAALAQQVSGSSCGQPPFWRWLWGRWSHGWPGEAPGFHLVTLWRLQQQRVRSFAVLGAVTSQGGLGTGVRVSCWWYTTCC